MSEEKKYTAQKKYLSSKKQLRVWVNAEKYENFKNAVEKNADSVYGVINRFIDEYLNEM